jgi:hypothetical protein
MQPKLKLSDHAPKLQTCMGVKKNTFTIHQLICDLDFENEEPIKTNEKYHIERHLLKKN